jgi:hypothetical protein
VRGENCRCRKGQGGGEERGRERKRKRQKQNGFAVFFQIVKAKLYRLRSLLFLRLQMVCKLYVRPSSAKKEEERTESKVFSQIDKEMENPKR